jgi:hypothetical protein
MNFSLTSSKDLLSNDLREAFAGLLQQELAAREPSQAVKLLYSTEPEQLNFNFTCSKKAP